MKKTILFLLIIFSNLSFAQSLNNYQYAIIPAKFGFFKEENKFRLNAITKAYFQQKGFVTYFDNEVLPNELANNKCKLVFVDVIENNSMLKTKLQVVIKDCQQKVLYTSAEGMSREKEFSVSYNEALRMALKSFDHVNYKYIPQIKEETIAAETPIQNVVNPTKPVIGEYDNIEITYAKTSNGYVLLNKASGDVLFKLFSTSSPDMYTAKTADKNGVVLKKDGQWFFEYYYNDQLISNKINFNL